MKRMMRNSRVQGKAHVDGELPRGNALPITFVNRGYVTEVAAVFDWGVTWGVLTPYVN